MTSSPPVLFVFVAATVTPPANVDENALKVLVRLSSTLVSLSVSE